MIKEFTYAFLKSIYDSAPSPKAGIYFWMHEYCEQHLKDHPEFEQVNLKMDGADSGKLEGKVYEFKRAVKETSNLRVNRD